MKSKRSCDGCIACCDGRLKLHVHGNEWVGRPCQFVKKGVGCSIYKDRPKNPCVVFQCSWLKDDNYMYPEWLKPDKSNLLIMDWKKTKTGIPYVIAVSGRDGYDKESMLWLIEHCNKRNLNLELILQGSKHYIGSKEFRKFFKK